VFLADAMVRYRPVPAQWSDYCPPPGREPGAKFRSASITHPLARLRNLA
jgi:hypothetical protein